MVRDSTKLLCRIIEEFENTGKRARGETSFEPVTQGLGYPLLLPGLTDRKEWPDATLKVFYYGAEINKGFERKIFAQSVAGTATDKSYSDSSQSYDGLNEDIDPLSIPKESISPKTTLETDDSAIVEASNATAPEGAAAVKDPLAEPVPMMYTVNGEGSPVEEFIKTLQKDGKEIPTKIMLTGVWRSQI